MRLTRRRAIELAGAATALAALRPSSAAAFGMDLPLDGRVVRAPRRFDLVGLDFGPAAHVHAELRARRAGGSWSAWARVHHATQPVWTGPADELQVRHRGAARHLSARFVSVGQADRAVVPAARPSARGRAPAMFTRSDWGGDRLKRKAPPEYGVVQVAFVHHTVTANTYGPEDSAGIVLGIARYHRDHNGWNDIGYNFLVDRYGQIFEGREGGIDLAVMGAQAQGYNSHSTGVSCIGDYSSTRLPAAGVDALAELLAWKLAVHGVPPTGTTLVESEGGSANRYREGTQVRLARISGHLDGNATACPGGALYDQLGVIRRRTAEFGRGVSSITLRADSTELIHPDTDVSLAGTLRFAGKQSPAAATVEVLFQPHSETGAAATYELLAELVTSDEGHFATELTLPGPGNLQAVFPGDGTRPAVSGTPITIVLRPRLELSVSPREVPAGTRVTLSGLVEPAGATWGKLAVHRRVGRHAHRVQSRRVAVVDGVVDTGFRPLEPGLYRVTLRINGARVRRHLRAI